METKESIDQGPVATVEEMASSALGVPVAPEPMGAVAEGTGECSPDVSGRVKVPERLEADVTRLISELGESLNARVARIIKTGIEKLTSAMSEATADAALRPVVNRVLELVDRMAAEREFLAASYRDNPELVTNLACRRLWTQCDLAIGSFIQECHVLLEGLGIRPIEGPAGRFDPRCQQIVGTTPTAEDRLDGHISRIVRPGYLRKGEVLRAEKVFVFKMEA